MRASGKRLQMRTQQLQVDQGQLVHGGQACSLLVAQVTSANDQAFLHPPQALAQAQAQVIFNVAVELA